ncbi:FAD-binding and (Fe-S)-binding domain-containing protein [Planctopirus hydrillae]|uniref:FAD-binding PCMH-type domain-containing protein n=1 Tax=Planctopirus hydrillae TaxID=1841610 RepID=A0A1C3EDD5_9PLAN|nr:FAD-binding and (Fe-S)-binding domain-containing protein [Planctopirus hydrillae]ODA31245.1 hypothetical protein A6X21_22490 [Planctopirus hydrillae]
MEIWATRIKEDLSGLFRGKLDVSRVASIVYSQDGGVTREAPCGVALPEDAEDLVVLVQYCHEHSIPMTVRGAGTSLFGQSLGPGLIIDVSASMNRVLSMSERTVRVEPGITIDELNRRLRPYGREFGVYPLDSAVATVGGVVGVDGIGPHGLRHGAAHDHVASLQVMLARGTQFTAGLEPLAMPDRQAPENQPHQVKRTIICRLESILRNEAALIKASQPGVTLLRRGGYQLRGVLTEERLDLCRLLVGSEGTLGLYTGITLHTTPLPAHRGVLLLLCPTLDSAIEVVHQVRVMEPAACDLVDRRILTLARELDDRFLMIIPPTIEAAVLIEVTAETESECREQLTSLRRCTARIAEGHLTAYEANSPSDVEFLWSLSRKILPQLEKPRGGMRTVRIFDDLVVPPEALAEFLAKAHKAFQMADISAVMYSHAAMGVVHFRPLLTDRAAWPVAALEQLQYALYEAAWSLGGCIGSTQGLGSLRTSALREQYGSLCDIFKEVKNIFDPEGLLAPGHVVPAAARVGWGTAFPSASQQARAVEPIHFSGRELKSTFEQELPVQAPTGELVELCHSWPQGEAIEAVNACNGCGNCRREDRSHRMCPFFHVTHQEVSSPRAKAVVFRDTLSGRLAPETLTRPEMLPILNSCFNCQQCSLECPSHVDIPRMAIELKGQAAAQQGVSRVDWLLSRPDVWGPWGSWLAPVLNPLLNWSTFRRVLELLTGVARERRLPLFSRKSFLQQTAQQAVEVPQSASEPVAGQKKPLQPVVYFVDHFANYHDTELAMAFSRVLEHLGFELIVPKGQLASGMALISAGELPAARELALENLRVLAPHARDGLRIICTEPTAALCLKKEYPRLTQHPDAELVAQQTVEAGAFLAELAAQGRLPIPTEPLAMTPLRAVYHTPCHLKSLGERQPLLEICRLIPKLELHAVERGCSGMAGTFGLSSKNFQTSMKIGHELMETMRSRDWDFGVTECSGCRLQMTQRTATPTLHPIKLMAMAYGLMPELKARFKHQTRKYTLE